MTYPLANHAFARAQSCLSSKVVCGTVPSVWPVHDLQFQPHFPCPLACQGRGREHCAHAEVGENKVAGRPSPGFSSKALAPPYHARPPFQICCQSRPRLASPIPSEPFACLSHLPAAQ
eukprot:EG_transcript_42172